MSFLLKRCYILIENCSTWKMDSFFFFLIKQWLWGEISWCTFWAFDCLLEWERHRSRLFGPPLANRMSCFKLFFDGKSWNCFKITWHTLTQKKKRKKEKRKKKRVQVSFIVTKSTHYLRWLGQAILIWHWFTANWCQILNQLRFE